MPVRTMQASDGTLRAIPQSHVVSLVFNTTGVIADSHVFIAPYPCELVSVREIHSAAAAGSTTIDIKKCTGTTAPASGTTMLATTFASDSTTNTVVTKNNASGLTATLADRKLDTGNSIAVDVTGTMTAYVGVIELEVKRLLTVGGAV